MQWALCIDVRGGDSDKFCFIMDALYLYVKYTESSSMGHTIAFYSLFSDQPSVMILENPVGCFPSKIRRL